MSEQRYVVKLANGAWLTKLGTQTRTLREAHQLSRVSAYRTAAHWSTHGAVALRLKPGKRAAELAKLKAEVEELRGGIKVASELTIAAERKLDAMTAERDAIAAQLAALPPDVTDEELANCRRLLRGPVAPARPVEELRDELHGVFHGTNAPTHESWGAVAKRARELGAR